MQVLVKLNTAGADTGPFLVYSSLNNYTGPAYGPYTRAQMLAGVIINIPNSATGVRVRSNGHCVNDVYTYFAPFTTTTSTTTTSTTTTTTTTQAPARCHQVEIIGTVTLSWTGQDNIVQTFTYSNITIGVCARLGSIVKVGTGSINITVSSTTCVEQSDCWPALNLNAVGIDKFMIRRLFIWGLPYTPNNSIIPWMIDYGDGFKASFTGNQTFINGGPADHTYSGLFTGTIKIKAPSLQLINQLVERIAGQSYTVGTVTLVGTELFKLQNIDFFQNIEWKVNANATQLPTNVNNFYSLNGTITGNVVDLPNSMTAITLLGKETNILTGSVADFPTGMTSIRIDGKNTIGGNVSSLPGTFDTQLTRFIIGGENVISGNLSEFATYTQLREFEVRGFNLLTGSICNFNSSMQRIVITGYSNPSGNTTCLIGSTSLITLILENDENDPALPPSAGTTLTGDITNLPDSLQTIIVSGVNTLFGNISNMPTGTLVNPAGKIFWQVRGENTITGNIATIRPNCNYFTHAGFHTLFGNIASIPVNMIRFYINYKAGGGADLSGIIGDVALMPHTLMTQFGLYGNHHVNTYSASTTWPSGMNIFLLHPTDRATYAMPTAQLNQLLNNLALSSWVATTSFPQNELDLCGVPGPSGIAAITTIAAIAPPNNVTITVGP